jgi:hypothetical protein
MDDATGNEVSLAAADDGLTYSFKPSMIGGVCMFRLAPHGMDWQVGRQSGHMPYRAIRRIRLSFKPVSLATYRFITEIWSDLAPKLTVASTSWRSVVEQERHDAPYAAFVRELNRRIAEAGGTPTFQMGSPPLLYWPGAVVLVLLAAALPFMLRSAFVSGAFGGLAIVGGVMLVFFYQLGTFFWRNRPGVYRPEAIPSTILPRG